MAKFSKKLIIVIAVMLLCSLALVACTSYKFVPVTGGQADKPTESNGGFVVKQGDYIYFVNGKQAYENIKVKDDNTYGKVLKGSICRVKKNVEGLYEDFQVIVPRLAMNKNYKQGFSIFGNWLYYVSPSIKTDKEGNLQTTFTEYYRCHIDGSKTEKIATIEGDSLQFKFTATGLIYEKDSILYVISYSDSKIEKEKEVAKEYTSIVFPQANDYKLNTMTSADYVYYTKAAENKLATYNVLYAVNGKGEVKTLIDEKDKTTEREKFSRSIKSVGVENGEAVLYYTKSVSIQGNITNMGVFGYKFPSDLSFDITKERQFTDKADVTFTVYKFDKGVFLQDAGELYIPTYNADGSEKSRISYKFPETTTLTNFEVVKEGDNMYIYSYSGSALIRQEILENGGIKGNSMVVIEAGVTLDWYMPERIGNDYFYINSKYLNYVYVADLTKVNPISVNGVDTVMIGKFTDDDKKAYDKIKEEEAKEEENN